MTGKPVRYRTVKAYPRIIFIADVDPLKVRNELNIVQLALLVEVLLLHSIEILAALANNVSSLAEAIPPTIRKRGKQYSDEVENGIRPRELQTVRSVRLPHARSHRQQRRSKASVVTLNEWSAVGAFKISTT